MAMKNTPSARPFNFITPAIVFVLLLVLSFGLSTSLVGADPAPDDNGVPTNHGCVPGGHEHTGDSHDCTTNSSTTDDDSSTTVLEGPIGSALCGGINLEDVEGNCDSMDIDTAGSDIQGVITTVLSVFSWIVGIASVVMIIYAGFKYVTSQGGDGTATARNTILYAVIGLVIVALAQAIVRFVIGKI